MNNPELYNISNEVQRNGTLQILKEYTTKIRWQNEDAGIDVGCGVGDVTVIIKNSAPHSFKKFVACDINENMVKFASKKYAEENISFRVLDISADLPKDVIGAFNHVFSFYVLHWIKDQEKAFRNIYNLLTDEGDCFITFVATATVYSVYNALARHDKWKNWLKEVDIFISPYQDMMNPENKVAEIMTKCGFKNVDVKCKPIVYVINDAEALKNIVQSVDPFNMPQEVFDEFIKDFLSVGQECGLLDFKKGDDGGITSITYDYSLIVIYGSK